MSRNLSKTALAFNAATDALNDLDAQLASLVMERDCAWNAANAIFSSKTQGGAQLPRNPIIKNGEVR